MSKCQNCGHETGQRTSQQNNAMHLFFKMLADALNHAGLDQRKVIKPTYNMDWTTNSVKEHIWKPFQRTLFGVKSTTELNKSQQVDKIHETIMRELGEKFGVEYIPFPSVCQECKHLDCLCDK